MVFQRILCDELVKKSAVNNKNQMTQYEIVMTTLSGDI